MKDLNLSKADAEKSIVEVKKSIEELSRLKGQEIKLRVTELIDISTRIFKTTEERIKAEDAMRASDKQMSIKLQDVLKKLKSLDASMKKTQGLSLEKMSSSREKVGKIYQKLNNVQAVSEMIKDLKLSITAIQAAENKGAVISARNQYISSARKILNSEMVKTDKTSSIVKSLLSDIQELDKMVTGPNGLVDMKSNLLSKPDEELKKKFEQSARYALQTITQLGAITTAEVESVTELFNTVNKGFDESITGSALASNILSLSSDLISNGLVLEGFIGRLFSIRTLKELDEVSNEIKKKFETIETLQKKIIDGLSSAKKTEEIGHVKAVATSFNEIKGLLFSKNGVVEQMRLVLTTNQESMSLSYKLKEIVNEQRKEGEKGVVLAKGEQEKALSKVNRATNFSTLLLGAISVGAIVIGLVFGALIYKSIARPLNELVVVSDRVSNGELTIRIQDSGKDEVGVVQTHISKMVSNLRDIVWKIKTATNSLTSSSEKLSTTAKSLEKGSQEQQVKIEQSATAITEMSQTILEVAKNTSETAQSAQTMKKIALQGKQVMDATTNELIRFAEMVKVSAEKVESLGQKSAQINNIIILIKEIAEQTNLLALNAAIEAARAGEQGKGFAVVADNVRHLAERTANATDDIASTVRTMQEEISSSVTFIKDQRDSIKRVLELVNNTSRSIDEMTIYVEQVADMVQRIDVATEEQSSTSEEVSCNMENVSIITRQLNNSVVEIKQASEELSKLATELYSMVEWFKVEG
ncbi:MAG: methyl-accepting chemotaxis protein, partial [Thermodesulfovibrionales bacterium]|nr:methyl-accepting chemotaxis protein [Thermodesulfovibrionales bacterium]